jgi:DNA-binding FrmR family transcriptional regulator
MVYFVVQQISRPLRQLARVMDTVRRTGDHTLRARWHSQDEIGQLVHGFNEMLEQPDRERDVQKELAATARASAAQHALVEATPVPMMVTSECSQACRDCLDLLFAVRAAVPGVTFSLAVFHVHRVVALRSTRQAGRR